MTSRFWYLFSKKISGEACTEELDELDSLVRENPDWAYSAGQVHKIWKNNGKVMPAYESELAFEEHLVKLKKNGIELPGLELANEGKSRFHQALAAKKNWLQMALLLAISVTVGLVWFLKYGAHTIPKKEKFSELQTRAGSKIRVTLPDSTIVWLNAGSKLAYNEQFGITNRNTTLTGEAFFDVKKSKTPFIIHTNNIEIKVLGTAFNVRSYPNEKTETSLLRGSVEITLDQRPGEKYLLKPKEKLVVSNPDRVGMKSEKTEPIVLLQSLLPSNDSTFRETSWVDDKFVFEDETFSELAVRMERWYAVTIKFDNNKVAEQRLSGTFTTETIQEAMDALQLSTSFHYTLKANQISITK